MSTTLITGRQRIGLAIAAVMSVLNIVSVGSPTPDGETGPPVAVLVVGSALGLVGLIGAAVAWRSGSRIALRVVCGALMVMALLAVPAFFVDVPAGLKALVGASTLITVVACVLMLSTHREPARVGYQS